MSLDSAFSGDTYSTCTASSSAPFASAVDDQLIDRRQEGGERLAGAGGCGDQRVAALRGDRPGAELDLGRAAEACVQPAGHGRVEQLDGGRAGCGEGIGAHASIVAAVRQRGHARRRTNALHSTLRWVLGVPAVGSDTAQGASWAGSRPLTQAPQQRRSLPRPASPIGWATATIHGAGMPLADGGLPMSRRQLTILQVNDLHGYLEPHPEVFRGRGRFDYRTCGGLARIAAIFRRVRGERPGAVLALDNGDTFHGTYVAVQSRGEAMLPLMNALEFDAMTLHWEFAYGPAQVRKLAAGLAYPTLAINVYDKATGRLVFDPSTRGRAWRPAHRHRRHRVEHRRQEHAAELFRRRALHARQHRAAGAHRTPAQQRQGRPRRRAVAPGLRAGRQARCGSAGHRRADQRPHPQPALPAGVDRTHTDHPVGVPRLVRRPAGPHASKAAR